MAQAVCDISPGTKLAIGPSIEDGFYYDFDSSQRFTPEDIPGIEKQMEKIISANHRFVKKEMSVEDAIKFFTERNEKYKVEILRDIKSGVRRTGAPHDSQGTQGTREAPGSHGAQSSQDVPVAPDNVSLYQHDNFIDLCRGPHLETTGQLKYFKLLSVAGAYWRGDEKREQLQRIYGTAFFTKQDLDGYLQKLEEAKKRDHRKLGVHLDLFSIHPEVGAGLIHWHPKGATVRNIIESFWKEQHVRHGYKLVITPHIASEEIYRISGHLEKYSDLMYSPMDIEGNPYRVKPMNCPNHIMIYKTRLHSYRELPLRIAELGTVYRYEKSGVLHGLMRVRGFTIDDAHIFCTEDLLEEEMISIFRFTTGFLKTFGFNEFETFLATRPVDFVGDESTWQKATGALKRAMEKTGHPYEIDEGGGAFYGPKIDLKIKDCLGRAWQCATIQFDFNLPERFNVLYRDEKGADRKVVMIHRALLGSVERFFGVLVEHYGGVFPLWLAPVQACVLSITEKQQEYAGNVAKYLADKKIRTDLDTRNETLNYKIREATESKISYILIVGEKEKEAGKISVRTLAGKNLGQTTLDDFIKSDSFFAPDDIK